MLLTPDVTGGLRLRALKMVAEGQKVHVVEVVKSFYFFWNNYIIISDIKLVDLS